MEFFVRHLIYIEREKGGTDFKVKSTHHFFGGISDQFHSTLVPNVDLTLIVDAKDRGVGRIDQLTILALLSNSSSNILTDTNHSDNVTLFVFTCCGVKQHIETDIGLGHEWELEVSRFFSSQGLIQNHLHTRLIVLCDKLLHKGVTHHFIG